VAELVDRPDLAEHAAFLVRVGELGDGERATRLELVDDTSNFVMITLGKTVEVGS
jgi:hypothetical protein